jgi:hypothetical protein
MMEFCMFAGLHANGFLQELLKQQNLETSPIDLQPPRTPGRVVVLRYQDVRAAGSPHTMHTSSNGKKFAVGRSMP